MFKFALAALLASQALASLTFTIVDDPLCHDEPNLPILEPTPGPTPLPKVPGGTEELICENGMIGFSLINAPTGEPVPGYGLISGTHTLDLAHLPEKLSFEAIVDDDVSGVTWYYHYRPMRTENQRPFAMVGDQPCSECSSGFKFNPSKILGETGVLHIGAVAKQGGRYRKENMCWLDLTIIDSREAPPPILPPDVPLALEEMAEDGCVKMVASETEGMLEIKQTPINIMEDLTIVDETVFFKVSNTIDETLDWMTVVTVPPFGHEVCDMITSPALGVESTHTYEAKCFDGFAYVEMYAHSPLFSATEAPADTSALPAECRGADSDLAVKYTFVVSCNCGEVSVPNEIIGAPDPNPMACTGPVGVVWGDPYIVPYDGGQWNANGQGEYILTKAELPGRPYDFEVQGRLWKFNREISFSWITGVAIKADVTVELSIADYELGKGDETEPLNIFGKSPNVPINFFVDGVKRNLSEGSGDHRVVVTVDDYDVDIFFVNIGVNVRVFVRPDGNTFGVEDNTNNIAIGGHRGSTIPGSFSVYVCLPDKQPVMTNIVGLLGNPNGDKSDDFMDKDGNVVSRPSGDVNSLKYAAPNWCNTNEADSLFTYPAADMGYDFDFFMRCDKDIRDKDSLFRRALTEDSEVVITDAALEICEPISDLDGYQGCLEDGSSMGNHSAWLAVEAVTKKATIDELAEYGPFAWETSCWSSDWVHCDPNITLARDAQSCALGCVEGVYKFLYKGELTEDIVAEGEEWDFAAIGESCGGTEDKTCAEGLECSSAGQCAIASEESRRRLAKFVRPDISDTRVITPLSMIEL